MLTVLIAAALNVIPQPASVRTCALGDSTNLTTSAVGMAKIEKMAADLYRIIEKNGWKDRWYQHVADEPSAKNEAEFVKTCEIVRRRMPGVRLRRLRDVGADLSCRSPRAAQEGRREDGASHIPLDLQ